jgi:hypothetical protein
VLTDKECRAAKAGPKPVKLFDAHGLHLLISTTGHKSWRLKYRIGRKEKQISLGLSSGQVGRGAQHERQRAQAVTGWIRPCAGIWQAGQAALAGHGYGHDVRGRGQNVARGAEKHLETSVCVGSFDQFGTRRFPVSGHDGRSQIRARNVREILQAVQDRGALETAHRLLQRIAAVYEYAIAAELAEVDPTTGVAPSLKKVLKRRQPAVCRYSARGLHQSVRGDTGASSTKLASRLLALTAARPGMVQLAEVNEFHGLDGDEPVWTVPAEKMKLRLAEADQKRSTSPCHCLGRPWPWSRPR